MSFGKEEFALTRQSTCKISNSLMLNNGHSTRQYCIKNKIQFADYNFSTKSCPPPPVTKRLDIQLHIHQVCIVTQVGVYLPAVCKGVCRISNKVRQGKMVLISDLKAFFSSIYLSGALSFIQQYDNSIFYILKAMFSVETKSYFQIMMALTPPPFLFNWRICGVQYLLVSSFS